MWQSRSHADGDYVVYQEDNLLPGSAAEIVPAHQVWREQVIERGEGGHFCAGFYLEYIAKDRAEVDVVEEKEGIRRRRKILCEASLGKDRS